MKIDTKINIKKLRIYFMLPTTIFVGLYEYLRHYPLHEAIEEIFPNFSENIFSVILLMIGVALFSETFIQYIKKLNKVILTHSNEGKIMYEISSQLSSLLTKEKNIETVEKSSELKDILTKIRQLVQWDFAGWLLVDQKGEIIYWKEVSGNLTDDYKSYRKSVDKELIYKVIPFEKVIQVENFPEDAPGSEKNYPTLIKEGIKSVVAVPMYYQGEPLGIMVVGSRTTRKLATYQIRFLNNIARQVGAILKNIMLQEELHFHATLDERCRLAREIHDRLAQDISYLNLKLKGLNKLICEQSDENGLMKKELNHLLEVSENLFTEARNSIFDLNTISADKHRNLAAILSIYLEQFGSRYEIAWQLIVPDTLPDLENGVAIHLIRIVQEALTNVRKHALASNVVVEISEKNNHIILSIKDNGVGFDIKIKNFDSYGLTIMRERSKLIGGTIKAESSPGTGTNIIFEMPLNIEKKEVL